jgi:outer membrane protein assembly factor BamB
VFGPEQNVIWRTKLPAGKSSPVFADEKVFVTSHEGDLLLTVAIDAKSGEMLWRGAVKRLHESRRNKLNDAAAPTAVTDGEAVYVFFADFGLLSYSLNGEERWRCPLPPTEVMHGVAASPVLHDQTLVQVIDQKEGSYVLARDAETGEERWRGVRPNTSGGVCSSPIVYAPPDGPAQLVTLMDTAMVAYSFDSGEQLWLVSGVPLQPKATPTQADGVIFVNVRGFGESILPPWPSLIEQIDKNGDGIYDFNEKPTEIPDDGFRAVDTSGDMKLDEAEWNAFRKIAMGSALMAVRPSGSGEVTQQSIVWRSEEKPPAVPSPLVYRDVMYLINNGGRLTTLDALTGEVRKDGRLSRELGAYFSSPVAAAGKVYVADRDGKVAVVRAGSDWELLAVNDLDEEIYATPAIVGGRLYVRTATTLYCFGES